MKTQLNLCVLIAFFAALFGGTATAQEADSTGLPGDHFSLEAALDLFKKAESLEDFEKSLNKENNDVNNLDLNEDGQVDYIRVVDHVDGDVHAIVLQVPVSASESQDVAVIELEKTGAENAMVQIVGDEDLYGEETIAEPYEAEAEPVKEGRGGPAMTLQPVAIVVNVWGWPAVRFVYRPAYVVYVSPWRWGVYPNWWRPFRPHPWRVYHTRVHPFRVHYHVVGTHRVVRAHKVYTPHRSHSKVVHTKTTVVKGKNGRVKATKTTKSTTVHGKRGGSVTKSQTTTKVRGRRRG